MAVFPPCIRECIGLLSALPTTVSACFTVRLSIVQAVPTTAELPCQVYARMSAIHFANLPKLPGDIESSRDGARTTTLRREAVLQLEAMKYPEPGSCFSCPVALTIYGG
ncbi:hypothetical protein BKA82DRAFT_996526 [Pisolithus tinctorius]|uniref:Uncharacterized protein n=1 Tax=Pisolithus tinctorius Marx 270 TaxID=870435 RepID=A0A0C3KJE0_PISTI|nr:hypothetical protein BKA82DRAFT_996526 [Pisolithus tinctorius]KIO09687.1 hypothetical protein M404DRAFT_996526 [Pisolithus tinctorius Marx 270]